jgi:hypothetical protein
LQTELALQSGEWASINVYGGSKLLAYAATRLLAAEHTSAGSGVTVSVGVG